MSNIENITNFYNWTKSTQGQKTITNINTSQFIETIENQTVSSKKKTNQRPNSVSFSNAKEEKKKKKGESRKRSVGENDVQNNKNHTNKYVFAYDNSKKSRFNNENHEKRRLSFDFQLINKEKTLLTYSFFLNSSLIDEISKLSIKFNKEDKGYEVLLKNYLTLKERLEEIISNNLYHIQGPNKEFSVQIESIPKFVFSNIISSRLNKNTSSIKFDTNIVVDEKGKSKKLKIHHDFSEDLPFSFDSLPSKLRNNLFDFQKTGIQFGIERKGRVLIADEMGIGKTIQAIGIAYHFKSDWPLLIICPSSLKLNWKNEIMKWIELKANEIQVLSQGDGDLLTKEQKVLICSYDLAVRAYSKLIDLNINFIICDESHYLKNHKTQRYKFISGLIKKSKRLLCLSGTPIFARPDEIFTVISSIRPDMYVSSSLFNSRYCEVDSNLRFPKITGSKNTKELNFLLENFMIRRLKKDVLSQLPEKTRQRIELEPDQSIVKVIKVLLKKDREKLESSTDDISGFDLEINGEERNLYIKAYSLTGTSKIKSVISYIEYLIDEDQKFLLFAHHSEVLNAIEDYVKGKVKSNYIRIDGTTKSSKRQEYVDAFQTNPNIRVAILSITACATGLTLTEASIVVFAELYFTPAIMIQAEDRAHRIGQKNNVQIKYLVANGTLDEQIYDNLNRKLSVVTKTLDQNQKDLCVDKTTRLNNEVLQKLNGRRMNSDETDEKGVELDEKERIFETIKKKGEIPRGQTVLSQYFSVKDCNISKSNQKEKEGKEGKGLVLDYSVFDSIKNEEIGEKTKSDMINMVLNDYSNDTDSYDDLFEE